MKSKNEGVLDRVISASEKKRTEVKNRIGYSGFDAVVLERALGKDGLEKLAKQYEKETQKGKSTGFGHVPREKEFELFSEHLKFQGPVKDFSAMKGIPSTKMWSILRKVAYYKFVIRKENLE